MGRTGLQIGLTGLLGLVACVALNLWLFRFGFVAGLVGLNVTKHVGVAVFCRRIGVNGPAGPPPNRPEIPRPHAPGLTRRDTGSGTSG